MAEPQNSIEHVEHVDGVESGITFDTGLDADAVEFCPRVSFHRWAAVGTYKLRESQDGGRVDQQTRDGTIQLVEVQEPVARGGRVRAAPAPPLATPGVFDIKWVGAVGSEGPPILGHAAADSSLYTYLLEGSEQGPGDEQGGGAAAADSASRPRLTPLASVDCTAEGGTAGSSLSLSLDWNDRGVSMPEPIAAVSMSDGTVCLCQLGEGLIKVTQWKAHDLEAWIASFNPREPHMLFTGADDRKFKCWDTRTECVAATMTNARAHEAGVCSIQCDPHSEFTIATGSYDEQVRIWDLRRLKSPLAQTSAGGGVWRLKWHPTVPGPLLCAAMHRGFTVLHYAQDGHFDETRRVHHTGQHTSLGYGADWLPGTTIVGSASFYDHRVEFWQMNTECTQVL